MSVQIAYLYSEADNLLIH